ncbi:hypothetical protein [Paenibacillus gansuensis]|uniref:Uncharacterized protein n=1 Tax=Paenibacillus gansuensis TaxID=306542 RepID=A0ABW5PJL7_9BACL
MRIYTTISYKNKSIPVHNTSGDTTHLKHLHCKLNELKLNLDFRRKMKQISAIELVGDVAIFKYADGTKLYMEVAG